jgi:hypothetical protein
MLCAPYAIQRAIGAIRRIAGRAAEHRLCCRRFLATALPCVSDEPIRHNRWKNGKMVVQLTPVFPPLAGVKFPMYEWFLQNPEQVLFV